MNYFKISIGIFITLAASRFIPHPPNFTSLLALTFYVPTLLGKRFIPALILSFIITDYFIGMHSLTFFTWGSVLIIGLISVYFKANISKRIVGSLSGAVIFYLISNFGVWFSGSLYPKTLNGLLICYTAGLPFFKGTILGFAFYSTLLFGIFESLKYKKVIDYPINTHE